MTCGLPFSTDRAVSGGIRYGRSYSFFDVVRRSDSAGRIRSPDRFHPRSHLQVSQLHQRFFIFEHGAVTLNMFPSLSTEAKFAETGRWTKKGPGSQRPPCCQDRRRLVPEPLGRVGLVERTVTPKVSLCKN